MDIYVRFFLSLLNARSPCRDCNSAIIPRLKTTYRTNLFANSYFCRTSGPHAGPIPQHLPRKTKESRDDSRLPYCVLCNVSGRYAVTCILASLRASLAYDLFDLLTHPA